MTWLTWRQYRAQFAVGAVILTGLCLLLVLTGLQLVSQYRTIITECAAATHSGPTSVNCSIGGGLFTGGPTVGFVSLILLATPVLAGLFLGAPLVAAEFEAGTTQFAWMQGITRARWFAVKAGWPPALPERGHGHPRPDRPDPAVRLLLAAQPGRAEPGRSADGGPAGPGGGLRSAGQLAAQGLRGTG